MRREVVEHHADPFGVRVVLVHEVPHALREIDACALVGDLGVTRGLAHVDKHEHVGCAVATAARQRCRLSTARRSGACRLERSCHAQCARDRHRWTAISWSFFCSRGGIRIASCNVRKADAMKIKTAVKAGFNPQPDPPG